MTEEAVVSEDASEAVVPDDMASQEPPVEGGVVTTNTDSPDDGAATAAADTTIPIVEDPLEVEMEKAKTMKIAELKLKLMAKGVLTSTFCEKQEFVRAYAELMIKESQKQQQAQPSLGSAFVISTGSEDEDEDDDDEDDSEDNEPTVFNRLPTYIKHRVDKLRSINDEREELMKEYLVERAKLEAKYHQLEQPLHRRRKDVVLGKMDNEIAKENENDDQQPDHDDGSSERPKGIPQFWVCALNQMPVTGELITEQDVDCLDSLEDITCSDYENGEGFTLEFHFAPNDYFENTVLTKKYDVPNLLLADEPILKNVEGCEIKWKPGKCLTYVQVTKQQRGKGKNAGHFRKVTKKEQSESFFHFFSPPTMPSLDNMDEEEAVRLEAAFDADYDAAQALRSHIIPKAVNWFSGDALDKEMEAAIEGMEWPTGSNE